MVSQKQMVLDYIREFGSIAPIDAFKDLGITRLADVVCRLRREGHDIHKEREHALNRYGQNVRYVRYSFGRDEKDENQA